MRDPIIRLYPRELVVDNFAGGGGASLGISWAVGRDPDIAINHDPEAIAMHRANHPNTKHYVADVFDVNPREACGGRPVGLAWFSPDCTFHSKARGAKPFRDRSKARRRRGLAGVVLKWAEQVRPRIIALENVEEFQDWGPLDASGKPCEFRRGFNFRRWWARLENLGYHVEMRELLACDFGAPTARNRLYILATLGQPPAWPEATHGAPTPANLAAGLQPYRSAADCIDWSLPCPSIFMSAAEARELKKATGIKVKRPLSAKTMRRIAAGVQRYVLDSGDPFIVPVNHGAGGFDGDGDGRAYSIRQPLKTITSHGRGNFAVVSPVLIQTSWGERKGQRPRYLNIHDPIGTIMAGGIKHSVVQARLERVSAFIAKHYGGEHANGRPKAGPGADMRAPLGTVTTQDHHYVVMAHLSTYYGEKRPGDARCAPLEAPMATQTTANRHALVYAFLMQYNRTGEPQLHNPLHTVTTKERFGLVTVMVGGEPHVIVDIGMRMLTPRELYLAQGFPADYQIDVKVGRKRLSKGAQVRMCGNSCSPYPVEALLAPNLIPFADEAGGEVSA